MEKSLLQKIADGMESMGEKDSQPANPESGDGKKGINVENKVPPKNEDQPPAPEQQVAPGGPINIAMLVDFLQQNPNPSDDVFHQFAEQQGWDVHQAEAGMYTLATKFVNFLRGGRSNEKGFTVVDADPNELSAGIEVEYEHTPDSMVAKKIAMDHLAELPDYYTRLKAMESGGKADANAAAVPIGDAEPEEEVDEKEKEPASQIQ